MLAGSVRGTQQSIKLRLGQRLGPRPAHEPLIWHRAFRVQDGHQQRL